MKTYLVVKLLFRGTECFILRKSVMESNICGRQVCGHIIILVFAVCLYDALIVPHLT